MASRLHDGRRRTNLKAVPSMPRRPAVASVRRIAVATALVAGALVGSRPAAAAEAPTGANFDIWYYTTNETAERGRLFGSTDLTSFVNQARCQCNHAISTRVLLKRAMTSYDPSVRVQSFVGSRCDIGQVGNNDQVQPCVRILSAAPNEYTKAVNFEFSPIWLVGGTVPTGSQDLGDATPTGSCESGQGDAGIWICIENGMQPDCQSDEFQVQGTQNKNSAMDMAQAIHYDFDPPQTLPTNFTSDSGDGAVIIEWDQISTGDVSGFRILCADADGEPLPGMGIDEPSLTGINRGTIYFTEGNLCPDGPFMLEEEAPDSGTDSGTDSGGSESSTGDIGSDGPHRADSGSSDSGGSTTDGGLPSTGIASLDWDYICSGHYSGTSQEARVDGLENGKEYQFLVVAYDVAGNPIAASDVIKATPRETIDLWEQCEIDGDICGSGGFCNCTADPQATDAWWLLAPLFAVARRRRRS